MFIESKDVWGKDQSLQLIKALDESSLVSIADSKGNIIYVNDAFCKVSGYEDQELLGRNLRILKSNKQSVSLFKEVWGKINAKRIWKGEICNKRKDGSFYWVKTTIIPFLDPYGNIEKFVSICHDITHEKEKEIEIKKSEEKFRLIFNSAPDAFFICDTNGNIKLCNKASETLSGYNKAELINKNIANSIMLSKTDKIKILNTLKTPIDEKSKIEFEIITKQGKKVDVALSSHHVKLLDESLVLNIVHNLTTRNKHLKQIKQRTLELEAFLHRTSHDLKAPLTTLEGLINLMEMESINDQTKEYLKMFKSVLKNKEALMNNLSNASLMLNKTTKLETICFTKLLDNVLLNLKQIENYNTVNFNINTPKELKFTSSPQMLTSIIQNLTLNAIKYQRKATKDHTPFVIINTLKTKSHIKITVKDNGIGIAKHELDKVFDIFYRGTNTLDGTGLGLYIAKNAVDQLNGSISVKSTLNKGSQFDILIPHH
ncbi:PAS domain S-box protein [Pontimicrobium aquaticum]|uniref:histidine kinase n=1 Tax=Pontimicrobium aquaticum TaxID=2565367 RepID=A0A4U0EWG9_9FLAO|nr:PAS domain S-box protein [Pontimicrobium aquaticum]TJY36190.1 PAS domain S-box protein [Pontimicrobium aquaticum]